MGRHRRRRRRALPRISVVTLTGLLPTGVFAVAHPPEEVADVPESDLARGVKGVAENPSPTPRLSVPRPPPPVFVPLKEAKPAPPPPPPPVVSVPASGVGDIPAVAVAAYRNSAVVLGAESPACGLPWTLLAGIGRIESGHAFGALADGAGNPVQPIYGPVLDGTLDGNEIITDTDDGLLDGSTTHDRAVGPMQFIPETWGYYASDGNGDGVTDPQNIFDATLAAGRYLCAGGAELDHREQWERAILRYNNSVAYVVSVLAWEETYRNGSGPSAAG
ncbi:lytic transglycosylase domain-containing protein [Nocardia carnea]|uniref:Lytic transglycosylase domain-containing protein n=1 Tax=Nocardia carnea TaxID=37328 RepID=A0ABW7TSA2_9NOCA|nr:lytic murein transglycosylase [Nocardia carnea]